MSDSTKTDPRPPEETTAALVLGDGTVFWARGVGAVGQAVGEVCFNTSLTGYQEIMTDPSYAGQIITFTFPHIGNVGTNDEDIETITPSARGCVLRADITELANWRAVRHYDDWLKSHNLVGIAGVDTRRLTRRIRDLGAPHATICHAPDGKFDIAALRQAASSWPGLEGMDLAKDVSCRQFYTWDETAWALGEGYGRQTDP
ncbi:MAG: carbamoyl-phosphate synthase domain-containing protein, partial [Alphaproteobacteria bacterium]